jgi:hypothetical protein
VLFLVKALAVRKSAVEDIVICVKRRTTQHLQIPEIIKRKEFSQAVFWEAPDMKQMKLPQGGETLSHWVCFPREK